MTTRLAVETLGILIEIDAVAITLSGERVLGAITLVLGLLTFIAGRSIKKLK
jgi:hypothetical protein